MDENTKIQVLNDISHNIIYMIGSSFVAGSAFTLLILLILDFVRRNKEQEK
jgi:hypothetical protein